MHALLLSATTLGSRALGALVIPTAALTATSLLSAQRLLPCTSASVSPWWSAGRLLCTSAPARADDLAPARGEAQDQLRALTRAPTLHLDGLRRADPGEPRYTAPYWIPEAVRRAHHLPAVLFTDPWNPHDAPKLRQQHAALCMQALRRAGQPLTAEQVRQAVNGQSRGEPLLATTAYVSQLLEHMRRTRLLYGKKNQESTLPAGHPAHPRLYIPLPYQAARMGKPEELAAADEVMRAKAVEKALRRLRNGKPPYPIHRRRARFSIWQHVQAEEAIQTWQQSGR